MGDTCQDLKNVQTQQIPEVIHSLEEECEELLKKIDKERVRIAHSELEQVNMKDRKQKARQYAFLAQQFINAHIAYQRLSGNDGDKFLPALAGRHPDKIEFPGLVEDVK